MTESIAAGVTKLRLKFPGEASLLFKELTLTFTKGEKVLLLGPSGCGKSTLLQVLSGLIPRCVEIPMKCDDSVIPVSSGYVFQDPDTQFCMPYVDEELAFVLENLQVSRNEMHSNIRAYLDKVGLRLDDPHILIQALSQGMKQRLAIACALAMDPDVLFLDEPTALLDQEGTVQVWDTIKNISKDKTVIIIEHKIDELVDFVNRIVVFSPDGDIVADGAGREIFSRYKQELIDYGIWYPGVWEHYRNQYRMLPRPKPSQTAKLKPGLEIQGFRGIRSGRAVIHVEEAKVYPGEWIAVVGDNGAGKSSLLLSIMRLLRTEGICKVNGTQAKKVEQLADKIAFVFQNPEFQFVTNSVEDEVAYSLQQETIEAQQRREKTDAVLNDFELHSFRKHHPYQLSMGQKRRLSVAASMVRDQKVLLLDEPTFGQDARNTFAMLEKLEQMRTEGIAIVMVTHDPEIVRHFCTRVWHVKQGRIVADTSSVACSFIDNNPCSTDRSAKEAVQ